MQLRISLQHEPSSVMCSNMLCMADYLPLTINRLTFVNVSGRLDMPLQRTEIQMALSLLWNSTPLPALATPPKSATTKSSPASCTSARKSRAKKRTSSSRVSLFQTSTSNASKMAPMPNQHPIFQYVRHEILMLMC